MPSTQFFFISGAGSAAELSIPFAPSTIGLTAELDPPLLEIPIPFEASVISLTGELSPQLELYIPFEQSVISLTGSVLVVLESSSDLSIPFAPSTIGLTGELDPNLDLHIPFEPSTISLTGELDPLLELLIPFEISTIALTGEMDLNVELAIPFDFSTISLTHSLLVVNGLDYAGAPHCIPYDVCTGSKVSYGAATGSRVTYQVRLHAECEDCEMSVSNQIDIGSTNMIDIRCMKDEAASVDPTYIDDATVTVDIIREDSSTLVGGISMPYVADSEGYYRGSLTDAFSGLLNVDEIVTLNFTVSLPDGWVDKSSLKRRANVRSIPVATN